MTAYAALVEDWLNLRAEIDPFLLTGKKQRSKQKGEYLLAKPDHRPLKLGQIAVE